MAALLVAALTAAACGTTAPLSTRAELASGSGEEVVSGDPSLGSSTGDGGAVDSGTDGAEGVQPGSADPGLSGGVPAGEEPGAPAPGDGPGPSGPREPVQVGISYETGQEEAAAAFGAESTTKAGSQRAQAEAYVKWINDNGGLAGHPIRPVWTPRELTDTRSKSEFAAQTCAQWTQDNKVVAGILLGPNPNDLARCLQKAGVLYFQFGWTLHEQADYQALPYMWNPGELNVERLAKLYADGLAGAGFFGPNPKVGLLVNDYRAAQTGARILKSSLASHGIALDDSNVYTVPQPASFSAVTSSLQALQNAQLKMRASGVTHILSLCWACAAFFMTYATDQKWYPRYGLTSVDLPLGIIGSPEPNPKTVPQLKGAMGVGFWPPMDVGTINNPAAPVNATWDLCMDIVESTGHGSKTDGDRGFAAGYCGGLMFLKAAAEASGANPVTGTALRQGAERLGSSYQDPLTRHITLGPDRHSGADRAQMFRFVESCTCFQYFGSEIAIP